MARNFLFLFAEFFLNFRFLLNNKYTKINKGKKIKKNYWFTKFNCKKIKIYFDFRAKALMPTDMNWITIVALRSIKDWLTTPRKLKSMFSWRNNLLKQGTKVLKELEPPITKIINIAMKLLNATKMKSLISSILRSLKNKKKVTWLWFNLSKINLQRKKRELSHFRFWKPSMFVTFTLF